MKSTLIRRTYAPQNQSFREDVELAIRLLGEKGWFHAEYTVDAKAKQRWGLVFAKPERLQILKRRSYLTQFDSTHKLNKWSYNMFFF